MSKKTTVVILIILVIAVAGGAFYGGMLYGKSQNTRPSFAAGNFQTLRQGRNNGADGGSIISGDVISADSSSITLSLPNNGGSKIIFYSQTTQISKFDSGSSSDLTTGATVTVNGTTNADGSVTAQSIQIRPAGQNMFNPQNQAQ